MNAKKEALRERYKKIRQTTAMRYVEQDSLYICKRTFLEIDWENIKSVCSYDPVLRLKEVDVTPLLESVEYKYPDIKIKIISQSKTKRPPRAKFDLIIVPTLAFDKQLNRLGWGGGWYDNFLSNQPRALKIGLCLQSGFKRGGLPTEPHDINLDMIVTEQRIYKS